MMVLMFYSIFFINCNVTEPDDDYRYVDDDGIFLLFLFFLYFVCLNFASFLQLTFLLSISFLNSTIHDEGPEI